MSITIRRAGLLACSLFLLVALTGCFQSASDDSAPTFAANVASPTPDLPTNTPQPPASDTPDVEASPTQEVPASDTPSVPTLTATLDAGAQGAPTSSAGLPPQQVDPGSTPPGGEAPPGVQITNTPTPTPTIREALQTATAIMAGGQQERDETATAQAGPAIDFPTFTPTPDPGLPTPTPQDASGIEGGGAAGGGVDNPNCIHTVVAGENLYRLALRYNTTVEQLAAVNGITNIGLIRVGRQLTIPGCPGTGGPTVPNPGSGTGFNYTVRQGDTLFQLSLRYGITVETLAAVNNIANINLIYIGDTLFIPSG